MHPEQFFFEDWSPANRIRLVAAFSVLTINGLARQLGLFCGEDLYRIIKGHHGITRDVARRIVACYPFFSKHWLLTGEGDPLVAGFPEEEFIYELKRNRMRQKRRNGDDDVLPVPASGRMPKELAAVLRREGVVRRIAVPIYGRWLMRSLQDRQQDGTWVEITDYDANDPQRRIYHEYLIDGIHREEHGTMKGPEERYAFDPATGRLLTMKDELWVTSLTTSSMEAYHLDEDGIFRCRFRRVARK